MGDYEKLIRVFETATEFIRCQSPQKKKKVLEQHSFLIRFTSVPFVKQCIVVDTTGLSTYTNRFSSHTQ